jgi:nucleotide-binding universal stress UspA family protein
MPGIIVGVDGSVHSQRALEWAMREAAIRHAPLTVLAVHPVMASMYTAAPVEYPADEAAAGQARRYAQEAAGKAASKLAGDARPASVTTLAVIGKPAEELINASRDADLLVVGSRGAGGFARLLMGSVSGQVAHHAHCPVVVVPPQTRG